MFGSKFVGRWFGIGIKLNFGKIGVFDYCVDDVVVGGFGWHPGELGKDPLGRLVSGVRLFMMVATA